MTYLLSAGELELCSSQSLNDVGEVGVPATHRHDGLTDVHTGNGTQGLAIGTSHPSLEPEHRIYSVAPEEKKFYVA